MYEYGQPSPQWSVRGENDSETPDQIYPSFPTPNSQHCWSDGGSIVSSTAQYSPTMFDQRPVIQQTEALDTSLSAPFWSRSNFAPNPAPLTGPTPPGTKLIEGDQEAKCGMQGSHKDGTKAAFSDGTRRPGMFYLGIDDPSDFKTWVLYTPWSAQPHSMLTIDDLQTFKRWTPLSFELTQTLHREYQILNPLAHTRLNTLVRWLMTTVVSANPECRKWRKHRQNQPSWFQRQHKCEDLMGIFFDGHASNGPFLHETIPRHLRVSRAQLETVIHEWMHELAIREDVHWITFRNIGTARATRSSLAKCFKLASGSSRVPRQVLAPDSPTQTHPATDVFPSQPRRLQRSKGSSSSHALRVSGDTRSIQGQPRDRRSRAWRGKQNRVNPDAAKTACGGTFSVFSLTKPRLRGELAAAEISSQRQQGTPTSTSLMRHVGDFSQFSSQPSDNMASVASQVNGGVGTLTVPQPWATVNHQWDARGGVLGTAHRAPVIQETAHYPWGHRDWQSQQGVVVTQRDLPGPSWTPVDHMSYYQWDDQSGITRPPDPGIRS